MCKKKKKVLQVCFSLFFFSSSPQLFLRSHFLTCWNQNAFRTSELKTALFTWKNYCLEPWYDTLCQILTLLLLNSSSIWIKYHDLEQNRTLFSTRVENCLWLTNTSSLFSACFSTQTLSVCDHMQCFLTFMVSAIHLLTLPDESSSATPAGCPSATPPPGSWTTTCGAPSRSPAPPMCSSAHRACGEIH